MAPDRLTRLPDPPPPPPPWSSWSDDKRHLPERMMDYLLLGLYVGLFGALLLLLLGLGLPKLLVAAHAAWLEALAVWGL